MSSQKWNLQDIRPPEPRKRKKTNQVADVSTENKQPAEQREEINFSNNESISTERKRIKPNSGKKRLIFSIIAFLVIVGGALLLSLILGKTELTIYPEHREPTVNAEFTASATDENSPLRYEILTLQDTKETQVAATGQTTVQQQAQGTIVIRKTTPGSERLIKNTRFRSPDGLIFRIDESVVVPGATEGQSGDTNPGTIEIEVFADAVGEEYNLAANTTFDIPGFEESGLTDLYNSITASNPTAFTGGFDGPQYQVDDADLATARERLQAELRTDLEARLQTERPNGFVVFSEAVSFSFEQLPTVESDGDMVVVREQGTLRVPIFANDDFAEFIASETVPTYTSGTPIRIDNPEALTFSYVNATTSTTTVPTESEIRFTLEGRPLLIWGYDVETLREDLAGLPKTAINNAITAYPGIEGARVSITPFWKRSFPEDPEEILIVEELRNE